MNRIIDVIIIVVLLFFFFWGLRRGLIRQIIEIVGIIAAFIGAFYLAHHLAGYFEEKLGFTYQIALVVSAIALFIGILVLFHFLGLLLQKITSITLLGPVDRIGGGLFGAFKGVLLISLLLVIILGLPFPSSFKEDLRRDPLARAIHPVLPKLFNLVLSRTPAGLNFDGVVRNDDKALEKAKDKVKDVENAVKKGKKKAEKTIREL